MEIGRSLHFKDRDRWRAWLKTNHDRASEIWLITFKKHTGKPTVSYNDAVEEALCFGWIDSIVKRIDEDRTAQRYTPRRSKSNLSETNKQRIRKLIAERKMTEAGLAKVEHLLNDPFQVPNDIIKELRKDPQVWKNFQSFPDSYKRIRVGWIEGARNRPEVFETRLRHFVKMTAANKKYGMVQ